MGVAAGLALCGVKVRTRRKVKGRGAVRSRQREQQGQHYNGVGTGGESLNAPPRQRGDNKPPDEPHTLESDARQGSVANGRQHTTSAYTSGD